MANDRLGSFPRLVEEDGPTDTGISLEKSLKKIARMPNLGKLSEFMKDPKITEIMVNDLRPIMIEQDGKLKQTAVRIESAEELNQLVTDILESCGKTLATDQPFLDMNFPDGSRINIVAPPITTGGHCITIRKFPGKRPKLEELINQQTLDRRMGYFLSACVVGRTNVVISGGTGSGKTTLLNSLIHYVPQEERIVTIEDTLELSVPHLNSVRMQTQPHNPRHSPIAARELVSNALRMRPDRIVIGECRKNEAIDMLQAMNTGHAGSMTTLHANSPRDALSRLETLCMMSGVELPLLAIRKQIVSAVDLLIHARRFRDGKRRITHITEVTGVESDTITLQDIFVWEGDEFGNGRFKCTGLVPTFTDQLRSCGIDIPKDFFA